MGRRKRRGRKARNQMSKRVKINMFFVDRRGFNTEMKSIRWIGIALSQSAGFFFFFLFPFLQFLKKQRSKLYFEKRHIPFSFPSFPFPFPLLFLFPLLSLFLFLFFCFLLFLGFFFSGFLFCFSLFAMDASTFKVQGSVNGFLFLQLTVALLSFFQDLFPFQKNSFQSVLFSNFNFSDATGLMQGPCHVLRHRKDR